MALPWPEFKATPAGTVIKNHAYDQCVAVANRYNEDVLGLPFVPVDSAYEWWSLRHVIGTLANNYTPSATPVPGAIVVWSGAGWNAQHGHIGTVLDVNGDGTFVTLEQNAGPKARYTYRHLRSIHDGGLRGFLVPNNNPALEEDDMYSDADRKRDAAVAKQTAEIHWMLDKRIRPQLDKIEGITNGEDWGLRHLIGETRRELEAVAEKVGVEDAHAEHPGTKK